MKVAITCNTLPLGYEREGDDDTFAEFDSPEVIQAILSALEKMGHQVAVIEADESAYERLRKERPDFVFNIAEGLRGETRETHIPSMLEMLGIPYTGSSVATLGLTLDKRRTKEVLKVNAIPTPRFQCIRDMDFVLDNGLRFPLFAKPNFEGSSIGITARSLVNNEEELRATVAEILNRYHQPVLVEEYLPGTEFTVAVLGNDPPRVLPIVEVSFEELPVRVPRFDCYEVKWIYDSPDSQLETVFCPARIDETLKEMIEMTALRTFEALDIHDLCRMDMRLDAEGVPNVIEVNALPGLIPDPRENSRFPKAAYAAGYTYDGLIAAIMDCAVKRLGA